MRAADMIRRLAEILSKLPPDTNKSFKEKIAPMRRGIACGSPTPGPQLLAVECEADEVFFGGSAGGSKTQSLIGLALTKHTRSLILRRTNKKASKLNDDIAGVLGSRDGFNGHESVWRLAGGRTVDIGGCRYEDDNQHGRVSPTTKAFLTRWRISRKVQFSLIITWNRTALPNRRCRVVDAGNPPTTPEVID